ncbi:Unc-6 protein precursor [Aphelenchoides avenae]|nr:Unc-6 protein precursor [Aphelenchus avenae]
MGATHEGHARPLSQVAAENGTNACNCHPIGSISKSCNQTSGQCICKPGVTGITCNRCDKGYQQSQDPKNPCIRIPSTTALAPVSKEECQKCRATPRRVNLKRYCRRDYVVQVQVVGREFVEGWVKYRIQIESVFKRSKGLLRIRRGAQAFWLPNSHVVCKCPKVKIGRRYLMMGRSDTNDVTRPGIVFNRHTVMMDWQEDFNDQLERFAMREHAGKCPKRHRPSYASNSIV